MLRSTSLAARALNACWVVTLLLPLAWEGWTPRLHAAPVLLLCLLVCLRLLARAFNVLYVHHETVLEPK
jgi:hypothetical protein